MKVDAPQWKKEMIPKNPREDYKRGVVCMLKISEVRDSKEEACKALMDKMHSIIKHQNDSAAYYEKQEVQQASQRAAQQVTQQAEVKQEEVAPVVEANVISSEQQEQIARVIYDSESIKQLPTEDTTQFPILALNDYCRSDSSFGKPIFTDDGVEELQGTRNFIIKCSVDTVETRARAPTKKQAKQLAAQVMIVALKNCGEIPVDGDQPVTEQKPEPKQEAPAPTFQSKIINAASSVTASSAQMQQISGDINPISLITMAGQAFKTPATWKTDDGRPTGVGNQKLFTCHGEIDGMTAVASANNKKDAKTNCACQLINVLNEQRPGWQNMMSVNRAQKRAAGRGRGRGGKFPRN